MITWNKPVLTYTYNQETLTITPWGDNAFRVQAIKQAQFPEERWALTQPVQSAATAQEEGDGWTITNGKLSIHLTRNGKLTACNQTASCCWRSTAATGGTFWTPSAAPSRWRPGNSGPFWAATTI